jgi:hypothetical protein
LSILIVPPVMPQAVSLSHVWPGRMSWTCPEGEVTVVIDTERFEFYIDATIGRPPAFLTIVIDKLRCMGLELIDEEECESEVQGDGRLRIYMVPIDPVSDTSFSLAESVIAVCQDDA